MKVTIIKRLFGDLIAAAISLLILASAFALPFETVNAAPTAAGPVEWTEPAEGAGRIENSEFGIRNAEFGMRNSEFGIRNAELVIQPPEKKPLQEDEEFAEDIYVPDTEEIVEVIPEAAPVIESDIDALIVEAAERYGLPWELVSAVVWAESRYNPDAISGTPDYGLMQVTASVCAAYGLNKDNRLDPAANLDAGCRILREKIDESGGDFTIALMKYNEGDAGYLENIAAGIRSTKYTEDVLGKYYQILREG